MALFRVENFGGRTNFGLVRELSADEYERLSEANNLVRRVARMTPYHSLDLVRTRFLESIAQADGDTTEDPEVRLTRCAAALNELFTVVVGHGDNWLSWVKDVLGEEVEAPSTVSEAIDGFTASRTAQVAELFTRAPDVELVLLPGEQPDAVVRAQSADVRVQVSEWLTDLGKATLLVMDAGLHPVKAQLDDASRFLLQLAAEVMTGSPIVAPVPTDAGWNTQFDLGGVDVAAVRAAQALEWQVSTFAGQIRQESEGVPPAEPLLQEEVDAPAGGGPQIEEPDDGADTEQVDLASVTVDLHRVIDAVAGNADGLASQWAQRFPADEFAQAIEIERAQVQSLLQPWQRALELESAVAAEAGLPVELPGYPLTIVDLATWSSAASPEQLWTYQSLATVHAFQLYLAALDDLGRPAKVKFEQGKAPDMEFDPLSVATLHAAGRLLIELTEENAATLAGLTGKSYRELGVAPASDSRVRQLLRAVKAGQSFGLPEIQLVYSLRLLSVLGYEPDQAGAELIETARSEVIEYISGTERSRGVALMLSDGLAQIGDAALSQREINLDEERTTQRQTEQAQRANRGTSADLETSANTQTRDDHDV